MQEAADAGISRRYGEDARRRKRRRGACIECRHFGYRTLGARLFLESAVVDVAQVDDRAHGLAQDPDDLFAVDRVDEGDQPSGDAQIPD